MRRHATFVTIVALTLAIAALSMPPGMQGVAGRKQKQPDKSPTEKETVTKLLKIQLQAARKAHRAAVGNLEVERTPGNFLVFKGDRHNARPDMVYIWSVRWLHAQRDLSEDKDQRTAAFVDHYKRIKELQATVTKIMADGGQFAPLPGSAVAIADWYTAAAELWLLEERAK